MNQLIFGCLSFAAGTVFTAGVFYGTTQARLKKLENEVDRFSGVIGRVIAMETQLKLIVEKFT